MLEQSAKTEMMLWLNTMSKRQELRDNPDALAMEMDMLEEALYNGGARTESNIKAVFHRLKSRDGLVYWPTAKQIADTIAAVRRDQSVADGASGGDRLALSHDQSAILESKVLPTARRWLGIQGLKQHAEQTLSYWGET